VTAGLCGALVALLAGTLWIVRAERAASRLRVASMQRREAQFFDAVRDMLDAARRSTDEVVAALDRALRHIEPLVDAVLVFVPRDDELACVWATGERASYYSTLRLARGNDASLPARAASGECTVRSSGDGLLLATDRAALALPMIDERGLRAVVYVASCRRWEGPHDVLVRVVEHSAAPFAIALERERDRNEATYDGLTGLLSPRAFRQRLREEVARARTNDGPTLSLWFLDTDGFKNVNDSLGHAAGDRVLQRMGELLGRHLVPRFDLAARNGGDEFCALVRGVPKTRAVVRAQALCAAVRAGDFGISLPLSASIGIASFPADAQTASDLLELADGAMYHSKRNGRDRVSFAVGRDRFVIAE